MKEITLKVIMSIIICSVLIVLVLGSVSTINSERVFNKEIEEKLNYASGKYANEFNMVFEKQENVVDAVSASVSVLFTTEEYENDRELFETKMRKMDQIIKETILSVDGVTGLYLTFNPKTCNGEDEIWYMIGKDGKLKYINAKGMYETWLVEKNYEVDYYFDAIKYGSAWGSAEYDLGLDEDTVCYSKAIYDKNGSLIGVVGVDMLTSDILKTVNETKIYHGGQSILLDTNFKSIAASGGESSFQKMRDSGLLQRISKAENRTGFLHYTQGNEEYMATYTYLANRWLLVLSQPEKVAIAPIIYTKKMLALLGILILAVIVAYAFYFWKKSFQPIIYEAEQKEIMIINQSRQAKLGEMVGNIAHQWKQPLNEINITLSNMTDDFTYGELDHRLFKEYVDKMHFSIGTMSSTMDDFVDFLKPNRKKEEFCVNDEVRKALSLMGESIKVNHIFIECQGDENISIYGFRNEFSQGIFNILNNARDAIVESRPEKRNITIKTQKIRDEDSGKFHMVMDIVNKGQPIPPEVLQNLFRPYFTTKSEQGGTGIGLYLTKQIIEGHMNGKIEFINEVDGVRCRISIPMEV